MRRTWMAGAAMALGGMGAWGASGALAATGGSYRDWAMTCSVGLDCSASTFSTGEAALASLSLHRGPGADDAPRLVIGLRDAGPLSGNVTMRFENGPSRELPASAFKAGSEGLSLSTGAADWLADLRQAPKVEIALTVGGKAESTSFSLSGLVATLRKMDEDQQRTGTESALIDKGGNPLPDRAGLPLDIADAEALPSSVRKLWSEGPAACSDFGDAPPSPLGFSLPIAEGTRLYVLACGMAGAYNAPSRLYSESGDVADIVPVASMSAEGPVASLELWNVDWSGDRLVSFFKGRGIGDCGSYAEYRIDPDAGLLTLLEERSQPDCNGEGDVASWPQTWPLKGAKR